MSRVRPAIDADVPAIASLFQRILKQDSQPAPAALSDYLQTTFVSGPDRDADLPSLVCETDEGRIAGFIGVLALPMAMGQRRLRAAACCCLMVDPAAGAPMAGAQLLRAYLSGPQDISVSETANEVATAMYQGARGIVLPSYSLDWLRVINPTKFLVEAAAERVGALRLLAPLAAPVDALSRRRAQGRLRWASLSAEPSGASDPGVVAVDAAGFAQAMPELLAEYDLHPAWSGEVLRRMLDDASCKANWGEVSYQLVVAGGGRNVGAFMYHARPGGIARVLQVLHRKGQAAAVVMAMLRHGAATGLAAMRGRTQPSLLQAMLGKRVAFSHVASSVVHARETEHLRVFTEGRAFFNGLAGDSWTRLIGDRFE